MRPFLCFISLNVQTSALLNILLFLSLTLAIRACKQKPLKIFTFYLQLREQRG
ncbi:MAG: hypothetical protein ACJAVV_000701 [Alphaproteobacteria bacterium]|jgi:hypothetical protein